MVRLDGYELILGSAVDAQFGPVILFGSGGQFVEVYRDRALALPPLNTTLAQRLMEQTKIYKALEGVRGRAAADMALLEQVLVRFSQFVVEQPRIKEVDINPLLVSSEGVLALDARIVLHAAGYCGQEPSHVGHPALPHTVCLAMENKQGTGSSLQADSSGRRADDGEIPRNAFRGKHLLAVFPYGKPECARGARTADPKMFY